MAAVRAEIVRNAVATVIPTVVSPAGRATTGVLLRVLWLALRFLWPLAAVGLIAAAYAAVVQSNQSLSAKVETVSNAVVDFASIPGKTWEAIQGVNGGTARSTADLPNVTKEMVVTERLTNPWLWVAGGTFLFLGAVALRQTRGLLRDVGSGVSSTNREIKSGLREGVSDPS